MKAASARARRLSTRAVVVLASLSIASGAFAASPAENTKFAGTATGKVTFATTFTGKDPLTFATSGTTELKGLAFTDNVCGLPSSKTVTVGTVKLAAGGKFSVVGRASAPLPDATMDGHKVVTTTTISGTFVTPTKAQGTLEYTQTEPGTPTKCGPITLKFTATG